MKKLISLTILLMAVFGGIVFAEEPAKEQDVWN
ncbi:hypothetical protein LCGC14_1877400, partial [marine sediment metagenome]